MGAAPSSELDAFYADVARADLQPLWTQTGLLPGSPPIADVPFVWRWSRLRELAERAGRLVTVDRGGDRRVLALANPGLGGEPYATRTLWAAVQYLGPGEFAPAHRHTPAAIRFVLEGHGVWTLVDRDPVTMAPGDLVLTPSWCWHEHHSSGDGPMLWFDGLDLPMVRALDAVFFEPGPSSTVDRLIDPVSASEVAHGRAGLADDERPWQGPHSPLLAYRWNDTDAYLRDAVARSESGHAVVRFTDPSTGRDAVPTMRCTAHRAVPGARSPSRRRTGSSVWVTYEGAVLVVVDGIRYELGRGDMLAVPSWAAFDVEAIEPTTLFTISDAPVLEALGLKQAEVLPIHQAVTSEETPAAATGSMG